MDTLLIASVCHAANRALCLAVGDLSQLPWEDAPSWQRNSAVAGVEEALRGANPEQLHDSWMAAKAKDGWVYGPTKDAIAKTHPSLKAYVDLSDADKLKDALFFGIVQALGERGFAAPIHGTPVDERFGVVHPTYPGTSVPGVATTPYVGQYAVPYVEPYAGEPAGVGGQPQNPGPTGVDGQPPYVGVAPVGVGPHAPYAGVGVGEQNASRGTGPVDRDPRVFDRGPGPVYVGPPYGTKDTGPVGVPNDPREFDGSTASNPRSDGTYGWPTGPERTTLASGEPVPVTPPMAPASVPVDKK